MALLEDIQYLSDEEGRRTGVLVPIELWEEISSELETHHLLSSENMKKRLLEARGRDEGISFKEAREKLGV